MLLIHRLTSDCKSVSFRDLLLQQNYYNLSSFRNCVLNRISTWLYFSCGFVLVLRGGLFFVLFYGFLLRARVIEKSKLEGTSRGHPVQPLLKAMPVWITLMMEILQPDLEACSKVWLSYENLILLSNKNFLHHNLSPLLPTTRHLCKGSDSNLAIAPSLDCCTKQ